MAMAVTTMTRTRGDGALAPSPMTPGGLVIPAKAGTYPMPAQLHNDRHSGVGRNPEGAGASPAPPDPAYVPLDRHFIRF